MARKPAELDADFHEVQSSLPAIREVQDVELDPDIDRIIGEIGNDGNKPLIRLYRIAPGTRKEAWLGNIPPDVESALDYIKETYGGGDYKIKVYDGNTLSVNKSISIETPKVSQPAQVDNGMADLLRMMMQQQKEASENLARLIIGNQQKAPSRAEMLEEMRLMAEITRGNSAPAVDPSQVFGMFEKGVEFAKNIAPREGEPGSGELLMEAMKTFMPVIANAATQPRQVIAQPLPMAQPQQIAAPVIQPAPQPEEKDMGMLQDMALRQALKFLVSQAESGGDAWAFAPMVYTQAPQDALDALTTQENWFEWLQSQYQGVSPHREWFSQLRDEVKMMLTQDAQDDTNHAHDTTGQNNISGDTPR